MAKNISNKNKKRNSKKNKTEKEKGTLFLFDEPTTGLHFDDISKLMSAFKQLVDAGHSLLVIEHNLDVIQSAQWIIDIGPEGGRGGGQLVAQGTPATIMSDFKTHTANALREYVASFGKPHTLTRAKAVGGESVIQKIER